MCEQLRPLTRERSEREGASSLSASLEILHAGHLVLYFVGLTSRVHRNEWFLLPVDASDDLSDIVAWMFGQRGVECYHARIVQTR